MTIFHSNSLTTLLATVFTAVLAGCGGGGGGSGSSAASGTATIASATTSTPMYSRKLTLTLTGSGLDQGLGVTATGCAGVAIVASSSNSTTATYQCTVSATGSGQFTFTGMGSGSAVTTKTFTVPAPQVTLVYSDGTVGGTSGSIVLTLAPDKTPITVTNFLNYVNSGFYAGTVIHRVSPGTLIQGGGYTAPFDANTQTLKPTTQAAIALEVNKGLSNTQWTIAMARGSDDASATSQFFINLVDNSSQFDPHLGFTDGYAVFGMVTGSTSTAGVTAIATAPCVALPLLPSFGAGDCAPTPNVVITSATQTL
jgi:peptidyl-prolyl cis-trans isomerase A (cyclophilin A)